MDDQEIDCRVKSALDDIPADAAALSARILTHLADTPRRPTLLDRLAAPLPLAGGSIAMLGGAVALGYMLTPPGDDIFTTLALGGLTGGF